MNPARLILITGLPGSGKTTLARWLGSRLRWPVIAKDCVKEELMDVLAGHTASSRQLSDASFAVIFSMARELLIAGANVLLEGNFRVGEHEGPLLGALPPRPPRIAQILCRVAEPVRLRRLSDRDTDPGRHRGHRDIGLAAAEAAAQCDGFLDLAGARILFDSGQSSAALPEELMASLTRTLELACVSPC